MADEKQSAPKPARKTKPKPAPETCADVFSVDLKSGLSCQALWWNPTNPSEPPKGSPISKGVRTNWCISTTPKDPKPSKEVAVYPGNVVAWRDEDGRRTVTVWQTIRAFQRACGTGKVPNEPPFRRGSRATVSGPGRG